MGLFYVIFSSLQMPKFAYSAIKCLLKQLIKPRNSTMKKILLIVLLFTISVHSYAQTPDIKFDHIGIKEGLPEIVVRSIMQDAEGYIWMGTQNGLVRYDGYGYKIYRLGSHKLNKITNTSIISIFEDHEKVLWISTLENGLFRYLRNSDTFQQYTFPGPGCYLEIATEDNNKDIWCGYSNTGETTYKVARFDPATGKFETFGIGTKGRNHINAKTCYDPYKTTDGTIWIPTNNGLYRYNGAGKGFKGYFTTNDTAKTKSFSTIYEAPSEPGIIWANTGHGNLINAGLIRFDIKNNAVKQYFTGDKPGEIKNTSIYSIYEDKKQRLWFSTDSGLSKLDRKTGKFINYLLKDSTKQLQDFVETGAGNFWLSSSLGLVYFNTTTNTFKRYSADDAPGVVNSKIIDNSGQLWIGGRGVYKTNYLKTAFHLFKNIPGNPNSYPGGSVGIAQADSGDFWVYTPGAVYKMKPGTGDFKKIITTNAPIVSVCPGDDNLLYVGTLKGLEAYNIITKKRVQLTNNPTDTAFINQGNFRTIFRDHTGIIWLGVSHKGISSFDPKIKKLTRFPYHIGSISWIGNKNDGKLDDYSPLCIYEDRKNTLWVGTNFGGLNKFDRATGKFHSYLTEKNKDMTCVISMHEDRSGRFWVGTYLSGLFEFNRKSGTVTHNLTEQSGLLHNSIKGIGEDTTGSLSMISERGITRYNPASQNIQNFKVLTIFPAEDIVVKNNNLNSSRFTSDKMAFSLNDGMVIFNPRYLDVNPVLPIVHISGITYSDPLSDDSSKTIIPYGVKTLELGYNQNRIQFDYIALHFDDPSQNKYAYKLDDYDKDYVQAGTLRSVTYTNLSPGTYTFHVIASNSDGVWNKTGASITIIIHTSLWMRWWAWVIYIILFAAAIYGFIAYRSRALKRENHILEEKINQRTQQLTNANKSLSEQQEEITTQRDRLAETVTELKTTQQQLVQSEKLASLGELTAGIAHEIQNPLNFVNNFSEVSMELAVELKSELASGNTADAIALADDIENNLEKIIHHGKRADGIVKNMLQHSRNNSGEKEPTDINKLAEEYLRLSYHGLRAKDKSFNSDMATDFDEKLPKLTVIPQDIGRVLLNLFNNAFYAVQQKKKTADATYKPMVKVSTTLKSKNIEIKVTDNGIGMPEAVKDKILQPFFTTKPTGEGTGLGLSMSYDIVVKGHAGKLEVNTKENEFTEFILTLPLI
jgi:signal transduction histidine kinase/ligand-binding sensor domain-containing protein